MAATGTTSPTPATAIRRCQGQGALRSWASLRQMSSAVSFVQRLTLREVSGQSMRLSVHLHFGFRMHCEWNGTFGTRSFERRFRECEAVLTFCTTINTHTLEGVASCITRRDTLFDGYWLMHDKITICRAPLPPLPEWFDGPRACVRHTRMLQERVIRPWEESCGAISLECIVD
jgi:hypothetical protein